MKWILCLGICAVAIGANGAPERPNVVVIMADDMGFSDIGCYGATQIETPNIDRLAENGLRYTQFYNAARCSPTRASLLTGLYPHEAGVGNMTRDQGEPGYRGRLNQRCVTIAEALKPAGYYTAVAGKWHVTPFSYVSGEAPHKGSWPLQRGFDRFIGTLAGGGNYFDPPGYMVQNSRVEPPDDFYYTRAISDAAVRFVQESGRQDRPLFLYVAYTAPHWPLHALPEDIEKYKNAFDGGWEQHRSERYEKLLGAGIGKASWGLSASPSGVDSWSEVSAQAWEARRMAVYAAMIDRMDTGIGRVVQALEESGRLADTLIMFLSDNGAARSEPKGDWIRRYAGDGQDTSTWGTRKGVMAGGPSTFQGYGPAWANLSNTPFRKFKKFTHEGGIATPLIVHWPAGFEAQGEIRRQVGHVIDLMPTILDVADVDYPRRFQEGKIRPMAGRSLVPTFRDDQTFDRKLFWEHQGHRAVREGDWKLVSEKWNGGWELYNLARDRSETKDLADRYPDRVAELSRMWNGWARRTKVVPRP